MRPCVLDKLCRSPSNAKVRRAEGLPFIVRDPVLYSVGRPMSPPGRRRRGGRPPVEDARSKTSKTPRVGRRRQRRRCQLRGGGRRRRADPGTGARSLSCLEMSCRWKASRICEQSAGTGPATAARCARAPRTGAPFHGGVVYVAAGRQRAPSRARSGRPAPAGREPLQELRGLRLRVAIMGVPARRDPRKQLRHAHDARRREVDGRRAARR